MTTRGTDSDEAVGSSGSAASPELAEFSGSTLLPGDAGYDDARMVFNRRFDHRPAMVAQCASASDVSAALAYSRRHLLPVAVRGGGNHTAGFAALDRGVVIDLSRMNSVDIDAERRVARVGGGALMGQILEASLEFGLAPVTGAFSWVGVGLVLGGGLGYLAPRHGFACDNVLSAEIVTADGNFVRCSETENSDLFWAVKGAGANFGVVVSLELALHPVEAEVQMGFLVYGFDDVDEVAGVLTVLDQFVDTMSEDMLFFAEFTQGRGEHLPDLPAALEGKLILQLGIGHVGPADEARREINTLERLWPVAYGQVASMSYLQMHTVNDDFVVPSRCYSEEVEFSDLSPATIGTLAEQLQLLLDDDLAGASCVIMPLHGAMSRAPRVPSVIRRDGTWSVGVMNSWQDQAHDSARVAATESMLERFTEAGLTNGGGYVNMLDRIDAARLRDIYGPQTYARLAEIKRAWDPDNVFCSNHNVVPAG